jgi:hypothetical protein
MPATSGVWDYAKGVIQRRDQVKGRSIYADVGGRNLEVAVVLANGEGGEMTEEDEANCRLLANAAALMSSLQEVVALVEMGDEANDPGTDLYVEVLLARELMRDVRGKGG